MKKLSFGLTVLAALFLASFFVFKSNVEENKHNKSFKFSKDENITPTFSDKENEKIPKTEKRLFILKDVGEPFMDYFGLSETDFKNISEAGFDVIEGNFDICANDEDVEFYLSSAGEYGLQVIMPAGSGEAEWGYDCEASVGEDQKPVWQESQVKNWVNKWKNYKNIFAWDTSNEAGSVLPNSEKDYYLTLEQLKSAYKTVKEADSVRPVMIRMNGWFFYDYEDNFFREGNPFAVKTADLVMINSYSNVSDYYNDFVTVVNTRAKEAILRIDPRTRLIISLGTWEEKPLWFRPTSEQLKNDYNSGLKLNPLGMAFFKYGAKGSEWYLINESSLWQEISGLIKQ